MHALGIDEAYRVERTLAEGRAGVTQLVTIEGSGPFVRKKIPTELADRAVWAALADCESLRLPQVAATYEMPDCFVAVYDYIPGDTLEHVMSVRKRLKPVEAAEIVQDICEAIADLHAHGVIHCDINPTNVVIAADGAHLIDFGIAKSAASCLDPGAPALGTWGFAAPEQYGFAPVDVRSDVYSLSQMLGYLLTGVSPDSRSDTLLRALAADGSIPEAFAVVVKRGSAFEPSARYQSAEEFSRALRAAREGSGDVAVRNAPASAGGEAPCESEAQHRDLESARQAAYESARAHFAAQEETQRRESRVNAVLKIGILSMAIIAAVGGVAILGISSVARVADDLKGALVETGREQNRGDVLSDEDKDALAAGAAAAGVQEGFDAVKDSWHVGDIQASDAEVDAAFAALSVTDSGWSIDPSGHIDYAFALSNDETGFAVEYPAVTIVGRDAAGAILFSQEQVLPRIAPGQTIHFGSIAGNGQAPDTVEFVVARPKDFAVSRNPMNPSVFEVRNVSAVPDGSRNTKFTGEVLYSGGEPLEISMGSVAVTVILRNGEGEIVYGTTAYADCPTEGEMATFETLGGRVPEYATMETYAQAW